ncbi:E3 ubiquitin-protein ligase rnf168 [Betta splendens]|uniref:RING-type E3 ubiquitin transferase n=1 Tax=Betta splendens TaxID=158456 RepID=A0A6P7PAA0_BETSP|nr:E3 ubiquitin-protein ligase rnf168 [Betta splendens]XP_029026970.1 E3 ubiquitin-protein ligase rnf168 [Betta splendens]
MGPVSDRRGRALSVDDCRCPVCLDIFMEPVTLPCSHTFCKSCFLESVDKATLCCPMCRKRVSTWARHSNRNNSLVNQKLWTQIQTCFPLQCQRRLSGQEDEDDATASTFFPRVSEPGALRQEYEDQVFKLTEEKRVMDEEQKKASEEYIQKLLAEEQELLQQDMRRREEDEQLARQLSNQLNSASPSQEISHLSNSTPAKKKVESGQIERFLCPLPFKSSSPNSNKEKVLSEVKLQVMVPFHSPPHGPQSLHPEDQTRRNQLITHGQPSSSKRKTSAEEVEEIVVTKRVCPSSSLELESSVLQCQVEQLSRRQQEEEDRHLALLLQKELDKEERQRCPDRRKGSSDAYPLRQNHRSKVERKNPSRASRGLSKTSISSPSPAVSPSSSKQTKLTQLFSNLRS